MWLGLVNHPDAAEDIAAWIRAGGPGLAPIPDILTLHVFTPPGLGTARKDPRIPALPIRPRRSSQVEAGQPEPGARSRIQPGGISGT
ncbi:hypothetical protein GCM10022252_62320 [Streptosporangium oxazolinicum]|uniref:Uncharacterized protein n=1 Tax=Streptosporangium oxazolinicum TaxID=909287 RepID=A0ABP8BD55_9ACTN